MPILRLKIAPMICIIIVLLLTIVCGGDKSVNSNASSKYFEKTYGEEFSSSGSELIIASDGDYVIVGSRHSGTSPGAYLLKVKSNGTVVWEKTFSGIGSDGGNTLLELPDGGYFIGGFSSSFGTGNTDFYLIKTDSLGNLIWEKTYDAGAHEYCHSMTLTRNGGAVLVGEKGADLFVIRVDIDGVLQWEKTYNNLGGHSIITSTNNYYIIAGTYYFENELPGIDAIFMKINETGDLIEDKFYGIKNSGANSIKQTSNGGYIIAGYTEVSTVNTKDMYLINLDSNGDPIWTRNFGGNSREDCASVIQSSDGGFILTGQTSSYGAGGVDLYLVKVDASGALLWEKTFGGTGHEYGNAVIQDDDGSLVIVGSSDNKLYLIKTDANGNVN